MNLLVFTDLDGTLLSHADYGHAAALPAIRRLKNLDAPLILASSKTAAEIAGLHAELGLGTWPAIVENGAALFRPGDQQTDDGAAYARLRAALAALPAHLAGRFRGFGDLTAAEVAEVTGLSPHQARLAKDRRHSEPGLWQGTPAEQAAFVAELARHGITARRGGRFLTLSFGGTKAGQMRAVTDRFRPDLTVALGDAPNDVEMIEAADIGIIVRNDHGPGIPPLPGEASGRIRRTARQGPDGWNAAILGLLAELETTSRQGPHG